jgi:hypothetical protein
MPMLSVSQRTVRQWWEGWAARESFLDQGLSLVASTCQSLVGFGQRHNQEINGGIELHV